jgi:hypothetical protein
LLRRWIALVRVLLTLFLSLPFERLDAMSSPRELRDRGLR